MRIYLHLLLNLNLWVKLSLVPIFFLPLISAEVAAQQSSEPSIGKQTEGKVIQQPPARTTEPWEVKVGVLWVIFFTWILKPASPGQGWFPAWVWARNNFLANFLLPTDSSRGRVVGWTR